LATRLPHGAGAPGWRWREQPTRGCDGVRRRRRRLRVHGGRPSRKHGHLRNPRSRQRNARPDLALEWARRVHRQREPDGDPRHRRRQRRTLGLLDRQPLWNTGDLRYSGAQERHRRPGLSAQWARTRSGARERPARPEYLSQPHQRVGDGVGVRLFEHGPRYLRRIAESRRFPMGRHGTARVRAQRHEAGGLGRRDGVRGGVGPGHDRPIRPPPVLHGRSDRLRAGRDVVGGAGRTWATASARATTRWRRLGSSEATQS